MGLDGGEKHIYDNFAFAELLAKGEVMTFGKDIDDEILICVQCGFCRAGCPVFAQSGLESQNARGRVLLAYSLLSGKLEPSMDIGDRLYKCTTCANCTATCPSGIKVVDIVERVREKMVSEGLGRPEHEKIKANIREYYNPFGDDPKARNKLLEYAGVAI
jgi:glycolate oxidase